MGGLQTVAIIALVLGVLVVVGVVVRRYLLTRSGSIDMCWRDRLTEDGSGWYLGAGKFHGGELKLYSSFSILLSPKRRLRRHDLSLGARRDPSGSERELLPANAVITRCQVAESSLELAMSADAATGLMAWLEAVPPSNHSTGRLRRTG
jgi:Protein of unknown function (DUF2550)